MPSLTKAVPLAVPKMRRLFVSFSVKRSRGNPSHFSCQTPSCGWLAVIVSRSPVIAGFLAPGLPVHRFRNHSVGSRCSGLAAEPRLCTVSKIRTSSADALPYSARTSKY